MFIHFTTKFSDGNKHFDVGPHYDVPNEDAIRYLDAGIARESPEPIEEQKVIEPEQPHPLKANEKVGDAVDAKLPAAKSAKVTGNAPPPATTPANVVVIDKK